MLHRDGEATSDDSNGSGPSRGVGTGSIGLDIERSARLTVEENEHHGPKIVRWPADCCSFVCGRAPAAELQPAG
jgi:hypothetical protein